MHPNVNKGQLTWILVIVAAVALGAATTFLARPTSKSPPPIHAIDEMGHLVSIRVNVADVVEFTEERSLGIPWTSWHLMYGGTKVLLIVKGDCLVGTDLRAAKYEAVDTVGRNVTVILPAPTVLQARVNHDSPENGGSRLYALSNQGIEAIIPGDSNRTRAIDGAMRVAQERVERAGRDAEVTRSAKQAAEAVVKAVFSATDWTAHIKWQ